MTDKEGEKCNHTWRTDKTGEKDYEFCLKCGISKEKDHLSKSHVGACFCNLEEQTECKHEHIENNMMPDTCRDCGKVLEQTESKKHTMLCKGRISEDGSFYSGNGAILKDCDCGEESKEDWKESLANLIFKWAEDKYNFDIFRPLEYTATNYLKIETYISSLLQKAKAEARAEVVEEILKEIEKMKKITEKVRNKMRTKTGRNWKKSKKRAVGADIALDEIITFLSKKLK